jgi:quercetin dioxygenase-like cupin family protein
MTSNSATRPTSRRFLAAAAAAIAGIALASVALAGECPADKRGVNVTKPGATANTRVTDVVLTSIDLSKEKLALADHQLRLRRLVVEPNGTVAWHSHEDRPAIIYIISGQIYEHASNCAVPILHRAGDVARENAATAHWWRNTSQEAVVLLSADILHDANDHNM